jgi:hypothetical protein
MYQNWALQWSFFQQVQQAAAYQNQLYQPFNNQQKPPPNPVPPPSPSPSNNFNSQQQNNNNMNMNTTASKWQPSSKNFKN